MINQVVIIVLINYHGVVFCYKYVISNLIAVLRGNQSILKWFPITINDND